MRPMRYPKVYKLELNSQKKKTCLPSDIACVPEISDIFPDTIINIGELAQDPRAGLLPLRDDYKVCLEMELVDSANS